MVGSNALSMFDAVQLILQFMTEARVIEAIPFVLSCLHLMTTETFIICDYTILLDRDVAKKILTEACELPPASCEVPPICRAPAR